VGPGTPLLEVTAARFSAVGVIAVFSYTLAHAQPPLGDPTGRSGSRLPPAGAAAASASVPILPPLPPPPEREILPSLRIFVREVRVVGNTVLRLRRLPPPPHRTSTGS